MRATKIGITLIASTLLILIPTTRAHATPEQLLPHANPKPIPDIGNYHVITNLAPYLNPGTHNKGQYLSIQFSTPEGYLCDINLGPHYPYDTDEFFTGCMAYHFPGMPPPKPQPYNKNDKKLYESIGMDNIMGLGRYAEITKSDLDKNSSIQTAIDDLTAFTHGNHTKYPLLQPGNIITYTPPYSTGLYGTDGLKPKPASCALGYNHTLWCASQRLLSVKNTLLDGNEGEPAGFYVTPTENKWYWGYTDPGRDY